MLFDVCQKLAAAFMLFRNGNKGPVKETDNSEKSIFQEKSLGKECYEEYNLWTTSVM